MNWLIHTNAGLAVRVGIGSTIFATLAILDIRKNGMARATRWREYAFLVFCVAMAICYGVINDLITSTISWEYFYFGKGLDEQLGNKLPPDPIRLHAAAMVVGAKATWTAGLIIGAVLLIANNPRSGRTQLPYRLLVKLLVLIAAITIAAAIVLGIIGHQGGFNYFSQDFSEMFRHDELRPARFLTVFGIHLGGYAGGLIGLLVACGIIVRRGRRSLSATQVL